MSSSVNPNVPATGDPLASAVVRLNFAAVSTDINNLLSGFAGIVAPQNPTRFQSWINTAVSPYAVNMYDGATWVAVGQIDPVAHTYISLGTQAQINSLTAAINALAAVVARISPSMDFSNTIGTNSFYAAAI